MRRTLILALAALALSAALCAVGAISVSRAVADAEALRQRAEAAVMSDDYEAAASALRALGGDWQRRTRVLELVTAHDALSDVKSAVADALLCVEYREDHDFYRASAALAAALERMRVTEAVRMMNLF